MSNKYAQLKRQTIRSGVVGGVIIAAAGGLYFGADYFSQSSLQARTEAENKLNQDKSVLSGLERNIKTSSDSEQRYAILMTSRASSDFALNANAIKEWVVAAMPRYRFSPKNFITADEKPSTKTELANLSYKVVTRSPMRLEFSALSDTHVFSFMNDLIRSSPGLVRIDSVEISRKGDMDDAAYINMGNGVTSALVEVKIDFTWIGLDKKESGKAGPVAGAKP